MRQTRLVLAAGLALALSTGGTMAKEMNYNITAHAGSLGGLYMEVLATWSELWKEKIPGLRVTPVLGGGLTNPLNVSKADPNSAVGITATDASVDAVEGVGTFADRAPGGLKNLRALARLNSLSSVAAMAHRSAVPEGVKTLGDLLAKKPALKWALMERKNAGEVAAARLLDAHGISYDDLTNWGGRLSFNPQAGISELMINGQVDATVLFSRVPAAYILDMDASIKDLVWLPFDHDIVEKIVKQYKGGYVASEHPMGHYQSLKEAFLTFGADHILFVHADMDEALAYELTKVILENRNVIINAVPAMANFTQEEACRDPGALEFHPGAIRACKDLAGR